MVEAKELFIKRISRCLGRDQLPEKPSSLPILHDIHHDFMKEASEDELTETFISNAKLSGTLIHQCGMGELNRTVVEAINEYGGGDIVLADQPLFHELNTHEPLKNHFNQVSIWGSGLSRKENVDNAERANVGIIKAEMGLAESGTVVLFSHEGVGRSVSLLPTYTITVLYRKDIRPRLTQAMAFCIQQQSKGLPSAVHLISGPSSTADIELVRVQGVHGPIGTSIILVDTAK